MMTRILQTGRRGPPSGRTRAARAQGSKGDALRPRGPSPRMRANGAQSADFPPAAAAQSAATRCPSRSSRRRIFPYGDFGISSTNSTTPHLLVRTRRARRRTPAAPRRSTPVPARRRRTPSAARRASSSGTPITATSATVGMADEQRLELGRRHLEALVLDQLLDPVDDRYVMPSSSTTRDVAGVQPAVVVDRRARVASALLR